MKGILHNSVSFKKLSNLLILIREFFLRFYRKTLAEDLMIFYGFSRFHIAMKKYFFCNVSFYDFYNFSPFIHFSQMSLHILINYSLLAVPPSIPVIYNEKGEPIESRAGPYDETGELSLMCVVMGGKAIFYQRFLIRKLSGMAGGFVL